MEMKEFENILHKCVAMKSSQEVLEYAMDIGRSSIYQEMNWQGQFAHGSYIAKKRGEMWREGKSDEEIWEWEDEMRMEEKEWY